MTEVGPGTRLAIYETVVNPTDRAISFAGVRDRAWVTLDGRPAGTLLRQLHEHGIGIPVDTEAQLRILVEDMGRVNYDKRIGEAKGLIGPARTATRTVTDWLVTPLNLDAIIQRGFTADDECDPQVPITGPMLLSGDFETEPGVDHYLSTDGWGYGFAWLNGFPLGRYWSAGPTRTLYVPGPVVQEKNELVICEFETTAHTRARFVSKPDYGRTGQ
jgi:beta-galactosidase